MDLGERCQRIELLLADVDGVMTDGGVVLDNRGIEIKRFHIRDGMGIRLWRRAGYRFGLVSLRSSQVVKIRASELDVDLVRQGADDKLSTVQAILAELGFSPAQACYVGDDLPDLPVIRFVGLGVAVADGVSEVRQHAHYVTAALGGHGAVRETIELILKAQRRWEDLIRPFFELR